MRGLALLVGVFITGVGHADPIYQIPNVSELAGQAPVVFVGESHLASESKHFVRYLLPRLKQEGFRYLALEMFNFTSQPIVDRLDLNDPDFQQKLKHAFEHDWFWKSDEYLKVLNEALKLGFTIVALDGRDVLPAKTDGGINGILADNRLRDEFMATSLNLVFKSDPRARVLVLVGGMHASEYGMPALLNDAHKIPSRTFMVTTRSVGFRLKDALKECDLPKRTLDCYRALYEKSGETRENVWSLTERSETGYDGLVFWNGKSEVDVAMDLNSYF